MFSEINPEKRPAVGNAVIGQSGGPTAAINATLSGVVKGLRGCENIKRIFGMKNGVEGLLEKNLVDLNAVIRSDEDYYALECTPAAALGSCRKKLPEDTADPLYERLFEIFKEFNIRYFFYIGGNDSMDTVSKLSRYAMSVDYEIYIIGVPKTIDNDLDGTDHTPGFGSAAKFVATAVQEIARDCSVYTVKAVTVVEIMGRDAGWLTAAAALPGLSGEICADFVYLPESVFDYDKFITDIKILFEKKPNIVVAVSEGIRDSSGKYVGEGTQSGVADVFGHKYLAGTARVLENYIREKIGCKVRSVELSLPQRCAGHCLSKTDIEESVLIGAEAARHAAAGNSGDLAVFKNNDSVVFKRNENGENEKNESDENQKNGGYSVRVEFTPVSSVANKIKKVPLKFINERGNNVTDELLRQISPLILGEVTIPTINGLPKHFVIE